MKEKMKKMFLWMLGVAIAAVVLLFPTNAMDTYAYDMTQFTPTAVSSPLDAGTKLNLGIGLGFETPDDPNSNSNPSYYFYFDVSEKGWLIVYTDTDDYKYDLSSTPTLASKLDNNWWTDVDGMRLRTFYLEPGRYYVKAWGSAWAYGWTQGFKHYTYFMPDSNVIKISQFDRCTRKQYDIGSNGVPYLTTEVYKGVIATREANEYHGYSYMHSDVNTYYFNEIGEYTISIKFNSTTWKNYEFLVVVSIENLGKHASTYQEIRKASFDKDGQIINKCSKCKSAVSSSTIYKITAIEFTKSVYPYTGKAIKPEVLLFDRNKKRISKTCYDVTFSNNKNIGKASAKITLKGSMYSGEKKASFDIVPKDTKIKSVTSGTKSVTVKWGAGSGITGYEVQASTSSSFPSSKTKTTKVTKGKTSVTISKLKAKTTYYVRVRTYKTVSGKKYASKWSAYKKVKVN